MLVATRSPSTWVPALPRPPILSVLAIHTALLGWRTRPQAKNRTTGATITGYTFAAPVQVSIWYNLQGLSTTGYDTDVEPELLVLNTATGGWEDAAASCTPRVVTIDPELRRLTVCCEPAPSFPFAISDI